MSNLSKEQLESLINDISHGNVSFHDIQELDDDTRLQLGELTYRKIMQISAEEISRVPEENLSFLLMGLVYSPDKILLQALLDKTMQRVITLCASVTLATEMKLRSDREIKKEKEKEQAGLN